MMTRSLNKTAKSNHYQMINFKKCFQVDPLQTKMQDLPSSYNLKIIPLTLIQSPLTADTNISLVDDTNSSKNCSLI